MMQLEADLSVEKAKPSACLILLRSDFPLQLIMDPFPEKQETIQSLQRFMQAIEVNKIEKTDAIKKMPTLIMTEKDHLYPTNLTCLHDDLVMLAHPSTWYLIEKKRQTWQRYKKWIALIKKKKTHELL
jgi:hypothetical protein